MKFITVFFCWIILVHGQAQNDSTRVNPAKLTKEVSYAYGYSFANDLTSNDNFESAERATKYVIKGLKDGFTPDSAKLAAIVDGLVARLENPDSVDAGTTAEQTAYNLGYNALGNLVSVLELDKKDLHFACIKAGYLDFVKEKTPEVPLERQQVILAQFLKEKQRRAEDRFRERRVQQANANLAKAEAFLKENGQKSNIKTTPSGLQYQIIKQGTGECPSVNSRVLVHYTGTFIDGKVFDSSRERGEPAEFPLKAVIQGWQEGLTMMRPEARYRFFIPPALAYGTDGPAVIPPNSLLIFDVELFQIVEEEAPDGPKKQLGYAYGYTVGKALLDLELTEEERNVEQFIEGFKQGFENDAATVARLENQIRMRIASQTPSSSAAEAARIAQGMGYASSSSLVKAVNAYATDFDYTALAEGYRAGLAQKTPLYSEQEMSTIIEEYAQLKNKINPQTDASQEQSEEEAAINLQAGQEFLTQNVQKEGVIALPSGLQYQVVEEGTGPKPTLSSTVTTHYRGTLIDGTVFDSSYKRGQPATFPLNRVIKGWQEGIPLMKEGAKYRLFIPAHLAYGNNRQGEVIPAGATLIFEVELLKVD